MGPGRVRFQGEVEVLFDSRISYTWHIVFILDIYALFQMVLDSLRVAVDVFEVVVEIFEVVVDGCRWL